MKKRLYKKLWTDKAYSFSKKEDCDLMILQNTEKRRRRRLFKLRVKEGEIKVRRISLPMPYKELEKYV